MSARRALFCSYYTPKADSDRGSHRILDLIRFLREEKWAVSFTALNSLGDPRHLRALQQRGIAVYDGSGGRMGDLLATLSFDLVVFAFWPPAEFYMPIVRKISPRTRVIVDSIDLNFLRDARRIFQQTAGGGRALLDDEFGAQLIGEVNTYAAADGVLAVSQKEAGLINDLTGDPSLAHVVPDSEEATPSNRSFAERRGILFIGNFQHAPNVSAVQYLCRDILPRLDQKLLAEHPVSVVGSALNESVRSYCGKSAHVRLVGWVPSLAPYLESTRVSVIPLLYGAGTKGKLLQALMAGTPTVSTTVGIEGLNLRDGEEVLVADDPAKFAAATARLLKNGKLWQRLARNGRAQVEGTHSREAVRARFLEVVGTVLARNAEPAILPEVSQAHYQRRIDYQYLQQLLPQIRDAVRTVVHPGAAVVVISEGSKELLSLEGCNAWHFLQAEGGEYAAGYPADSAAAIAQLEALRAKGGEYLLIPGPAFWWLDYYPEFRQHLENHYPEVARHKDVCLIHVLNKSTAEQGHGKAVDIKQRRRAAGAGNDRAGRTAQVRASVVESFPCEAGPVLEAGEGVDGAVAAPGQSTDVKLIAFYLPQFHPIPENDAWWGEGFTEWSNVAKAEPLFSGHYQPHLPADLGFYDLRLAETRQQQAELAGKYGIGGFCYYHYWFHGKLLLERPFNEVLSSGKPDFPFCLCWANEPWSRRWHGMPEDVLQDQIYSEEDDLAHIRWLLPALADPRAIRIEGKPLLLVYSPKTLPDPDRLVETWRQEVLKAGLKGIHLLGVETGWTLGWDATRVGFDAAVLFQPQYWTLFNSHTRIPVPDKSGLRVFDYEKAWPILANPEPVAYRRYESVFPRWDNSPRVCEQAVVLHHSTPQAYEQWLRQAIQRAQSQPPAHRIVFLNAWNEWAEGCHLEPDMFYGDAYLQATRSALDSAGKAPRGQIGNAAVPVKIASRPPRIFVADRL
ncbi:MAG: glycoside hydrolase family 99-like domain-containing protein [Acidobacteria bacterium]|nr:glycoside hydrolase family 99-like domain-containing protein [Acidobacteriota bacterium]